MGNSRHTDADLTVDLILEYAAKSLNEFDAEKIVPEDILLCRQRIFDVCFAVIILNCLSKHFGFKVNLSNYDGLCKHAKKYFCNSPVISSLENLTRQEKNYLLVFLSKFAATSTIAALPVDVYERLHPFHFKVAGDTIETVQDKSAQNGIGAYYTPSVFADLCVQKVVGNYICSKLKKPDASNILTAPTAQERRRMVAILAESKIGDLSCGGGRFLISVLKCFISIANGVSRNLKSDVAAFAHNIYGIDVDYLSLEIALCGLACAANDISLMCSLRSNFVQGNPLLPAPSKESKRKPELFAIRDVYNPEMGCVRGKLPESFSLLVGNPPWEKIRFEERSFFSSFAPKIAEYIKKDERVDAIDLLSRVSPELHSYYRKIFQSYVCAKSAIKTDPRFVKSSNGELSACALFSELAVNSISGEGRIGLLIKSSIATTPAHAPLFNYLLSERKLIGIWDFINTKKIFAIDGRERFSFIMLGGHGDDSFRVRMGLLYPKDIEQSQDMRLSGALLRRINPITGMLPNVKSEKDLGMLVSITSKGQPFYKVYPETKFGRLVHYTSHARYISRQQNASNIPVYEGKFIAPYDGRFSSYDGVSLSMRYLGKSHSRLMPENVKKNRDAIPLSRYFIERDRWRDLTKNYPGKYSLMWRSLTSASNSSVCIATILPHLPASQSIQFLQLPNSKDLAVLLAVFNSDLFNKVLRLKMSGIDLTQNVIRQIPVPPRERYSERVSYKGKKDSLANHLIRRVSALLADDARLDNFRREIGCGLITLRTLGQSRLAVISEINDLVAVAYRCNWGCAKLAARTLVH